MLLLTLNLLLSLVACYTSTHSAHPKRAADDLIVTKVPDHVRPYVVRAYTLDGVQVGPQVYRFPVTGSSSGNAFTLISTAAPASSELGVLPHLHMAHYENFYCLRGRYALWTSKENSTSGRILTPGDYGAVPHNTTHSFQLLDPFVEMIGVIQPGGFEDLFYFIASANYSSSTYAPFPQGNYTTPGGDADTISKLEQYDVHAQLEFSPPMDFNANGATEGTATWHDGNNELAVDSKTPFFVANGYGPKYLVGDASSYFIIEPFITSLQSDGNFTEGTLAMSKLAESKTAQQYTLPGHTALEVVDGLVEVEIDGFDGLLLSVGDVIFIPANTTFSFGGKAAYSKVLYIGQGKDTLDSRLIIEAKEWTSASWPA